MKSPDEHTPDKTQRGGIQAKRMALILVPILIIALGAAAIAVYGPPAAIAGWFAPKLVSATGVATYAGQPVHGGLIQTTPLDGQPSAPVGFIGPDGHFKLETQIDAQYVDGAYPGRYKVAVNSGQTKFMGVIPLVPVKYFNLADTQLMIEVSKSPEKNNFKLDLEGELSEEAQQYLARKASEESQKAAPAAEKTDETPEKEAAPSEDSGAGADSSKPVPPS